MRKLQTVSLFIALFSVAQLSFSQCTTTLAAGLYVNETWSAAGSPYCITGDIRVSLLTLEPGVEVLVDGPYEIAVLSTITAIGTAENPILFSARAPLDPDNQRWKGIKFQNTPPGSNLTHTVIEYSDDSGITLVDSVAPIIENCKINNNSSTNSGGGINADGVISDLELLNCWFTGNTATVHGGALRVDMAEGFKIIIKDSIFKDNTSNPSHTAGNRVGGALWLNTGDAEIMDNSFVGNRSNSRCYGTFGCNVIARGGAIYIGSSGSVVLENNYLAANQTYAGNSGDCIFGGSTLSYGGALYVNSGMATLSNNIFAENLTTWSNCRPADNGGGVYVNGGTVTMVNDTVVDNPDSTGVYLAGGVLDLKNGIIFNNNGGGTQIGGSVTVTYSDVQGGFDGEGNVLYDPVLSSCYQPVLGSPAIDAGDPSIEFDDVCEPPSISLGLSRNDMGAYGGPGACNWKFHSGDFDKDCDVDGSDLAVFSADFGRIDCDVGDTCEADFDEDFDVDGSDLVIFSDRFGAINCGPWPSAVCSP